MIALVCPQDYRYMALKDLFSELAKGTLQLERSSERKIFQVLLDHLRHAGLCCFCCVASAY